MKTDPMMIAIDEGWGCLSYAADLALRGIRGRCHG